MTSIFFIGTYWIYLLTAVFIIFQLLKLLWYLKGRQEQHYSQQRFLQLSKEIRKIGRKNY